MRPSEVESPMCSTVWHDVRSGALAEAAFGVWDAEGPALGLPLPLFGGSRLVGPVVCAAVAVALGWPPGNAPARPAQATTSTPDAAAMTAQPIIPARPDRPTERRSQWADLARFQSFSSAP